MKPLDRPWQDAAADLWKRQRLTASKERTMGGDHARVAEDLSLEQGLAATFRGMPLQQGV